MLQLEVTTGRYYTIGRLSNGTSFDDIE